MSIEIYSKWLKHCYENKFRPVTKLCRRVVGKVGDSIRKRGVLTPNTWDHAVIFVFTIYLGGTFPNFFLRSSCADKRTPARLMLQFWFMLHRRQQATETMGQNPESVLHNTSGPGWFVSWRSFGVWSSSSGRRVSSCIVRFHRLCLPSAPRCWRPVRHQRNRYSRLQPK